MLRILLVVLLIGFVSGIEVDFDCPDDIYAGEEFECEVGVIDGDATYDLKVEVDEERDSVLRIWDGEVWKSGYYYVVGFVRKSEDVRLIIEEEGRYDVVVKLRDGDYREEFEVGKIRVERAQIEEGKEENRTRMGTDFVDENGVISLGENEVISLSGDVVDESEEEWDYVSKDGKIVDWLPYGFGLFMIFLVGVLVWDKF